MSNSTRITSSSKIICWHLTKQCTQNCDFCLSRSSPKEDLKEVTNYESIIDRMSFLGIEKISYSGGEPFLLPNFKNIIKYAHKKMITQIVTTNGDVLDKYDIDTLKHFQYIKFSFHGMSKRHDFIMGENHFEKTITNICNLHKNNIIVGINYLLTKSSCYDLEDFFNYIKDYNIYNILLQSYIPTGIIGIDNKYMMLEDIDISFLSQYVHYFEHGIKYFNYKTNEGFQVFMDDELNIFLPNIYKSSNFCYGNIFENEKKFKDIGIVRLRELIENASEKRQKTTSIRMF